MVIFLLSRKYIYPHLNEEQGFFKISDLGNLSKYTISGLNYKNFKILKNCTIFCI